MLSRRQLLVAGTATFVLGLLVLLPARVAWQWFAPPGVALAGIEGSVWNGTAREASAQGVYLRDLAWHFLPARLFTGQLAYAFEAVPGGGFLNAELGVALGGQVHIDGLRGSLPLPILETVFGVPGLQGTANIDFTTIAIDDGQPVDADGTVETSGLVVPLIAPSTLGRYRAEVQTQDGAIVASVVDDGAVVDLAGRFQLQPDGAYDFLGYVAPTDSTPASLLQQMQYLGSPNAQGQYELRLSGRY